MSIEAAAFARMDVAQVRRVAVIRALFLGDMLCAVPAMRALRAKLPQAEIVLIGLPWAAEFAQRYSKYFDDFLPFAGFPGLPEQPLEPDRIHAFFAATTRRRFDLAIQMHGSGAHINTATVLCGAQFNAGYFLPDEYCPDPLRFLSYPEKELEVWRHLRLMKFLGAASQGDHLEFPLHEVDRRQLFAATAPCVLRPNEYVCIHPGAKFISRRWPAARYAAVAQALWRDGLQIVITGTASELPLAAELSTLLDFPHTNLAGRTTLGALAALLSEARLVLTNDTGVSHLAAAVQAPSVVVVLGSDPQRWAPADARRHRLVMHPVDCRPCEHVICPIAFPCATQLSPERVLEVVRGLLRDTCSKGDSPRGARSCSLPKGKTRPHRATGQSARLQLACANGRTLETAQTELPSCAR